MAVSCDSSNESGKSQLKIFWKVFSILDTIRAFLTHALNYALIHANIVEIWKKLILTLMDDLIQDVIGGSNCRHK